MDYTNILNKFKSIGLTDMQRKQVMDVIEVVVKESSDNDSTTRNLILQKTNTINKAINTVNENIEILNTACEQNDKNIQLTSADVNTINENLKSYVTKSTDLYTLTDDSDLSEVITLLNLVVDKLK